MLSFFLYFLIGLLTDIITAKYIQACSRSKALSSAIYSGIITTVNIFIISNYLESKNIFLLCGFISGTIVGTYLGVYFSKHKKN